VLRPAEHFVTVSSQLYFCGAPIRLDSYNRCQFACSYCFSRARVDSTASSGLRQANPKAFAKRLARVSRGDVRSALDEFLHARVPIQLGGMQDPFSPWERQHGVTIRLLEVLRDWDYPTIISTKGDLWLADPYAKLVGTMNTYVRVSAAGIEEERRSKVDVGCGSFESVLQRITRGRNAGIQVALRIQPVVPGSEAAALEMAERAAASGAMQVSFEYLKMPSEDLPRESARLQRATGRDVWTVMKERGVTRVGRDYTLTAESKLAFLTSAKAVCRRRGVWFGAGDTEFIPCSDGAGCCNGSSLFLKRSRSFAANLVGVIASRATGELIRFRDLEQFWRPAGNVHHYLNSNSRTRSADRKLSSWMALVAHRWNGSVGPYSPTFFWGVSWTGKFDRDGYRIYRRENSGLPDA
jgi:DNA repair photolyase